MSATQQAIGFWRGFSALFGAIRTLLRLTRAWPYAIVPVIVFVLLEAAIATAAWELLKPWVNAKLTGDSGWQNTGAEVLSWVSVGLAAALGLVVSAFLAPPISAPVLIANTVMNENSEGRRACLNKTSRRDTPLLRAIRMKSSWSVVIRSVRSKRWYTATAGRASVSAGSTIA